MNQFDYEQEGRALTKKALSILEKPPEVQKDDPFDLNASLVTTFVIVRTVDEYRSGQGVKFQPDHLHQVFRETNQVYGYKDLKITIFVTAVRLIPMLTYKYEEMCEDADDIEKQLEVLYEGGYLREKEEKQFLQLLEQEQGLKPIGEHQHSYELKGNTYEVFYASGETRGFAEYKPYLQPFLLILIDGAQFPCDSPNWGYFTLYEKSTIGYSFVGLGTLYKFYLSSSCSRHRISQMLFLPNFQRKGHGGQLLTAMYKYSQADAICKQITLEDPSEDFQVMRDITDVKLLLPDFPAIHNIKQIDDIAQLRELTLHKDTVKAIMKKSKLYSQQVKRVYQILLYALINKKNKSLMSEYGNLVLNNLKSQMKPYQRAKNPLVVFEGGQTLNAQQMHFLEQSERMQRKILDYQELLMEELSFYELIQEKLKRDKVL